jgi:hypothetical protein
LEEPFPIDWLKLSVPPEKFFSASVGVSDKVATAISGLDVDRATDRELWLAQKQGISLSLLIGFRNDTL